MQGAAHRNLGMLIVSIAFILFSGGFLAWSYAYGPNVRVVPLLVGWTTLILAIADFILGLRKDGGLSKEPQAAGGSGRKVALPFYRVREVQSIGWLLGLVVGIYLVGFLVISPIFVSASLYVRGKIGWRTAGLAAGLVSIGIWFFFSRIMHYELFRGILLEQFY